MKLNEFRYSEEPGGTFTHDGHEYYLNPLLSITRNYPVNDFSIDALKWVMDYSNDDRDVEYADIDIPIIVGRFEDKFVVLDGFHRLKKAMQLGKETIPGKFVDDDTLSYFKVDK